MSDDLDFSDQLLPFQRTILHQLLPPPDSPQTGDALLILARGLGIRSIIYNLLRIYDSPGNLVLVVSATPEEEIGLNGGALKVKAVGGEMVAPAREELYKNGGIISVGHRILVVDMLNGRIPVEHVTGIVVLNAEGVRPTSQEAFVVRLFRSKNRTGFIKAFSDKPESFTFGLQPLQTVLTQLKIREVLIWPRFHDEISADLVKRKADVIELHQPLTDSMTDIQGAIIDCMEATLNEIRRSNTTLDIEELTVENALFESFGGLVRAQLAPVWDKVGAKTKGLVADLKTLRGFQHDLLSSDCIHFNRVLESYLSTQNNYSGASSNRAPWLETPAGNSIFTLAKARVYRKTVAAPPGFASSSNGNGVNAAPPVDTVDEDFGITEEDEAAMRAIEEEEDEERREKEAVRKAIADVERLERAEEEAQRPPVEETREARDERQRREAREEKQKQKPFWMPSGIEEVLEEQPKWGLLAAVLEEIEEELHWAPEDLNGYSNNTILIMCSSTQACLTLSKYLLTLAYEDSTSSFLRSKLTSYFYWKAGMGRMQRNLREGGGSSKWGGAYKKNKGKGADNSKGGNGSGSGGVESAALKRKDAYVRGQAPNNKRRRVRGGGMVNVSTGGVNHGGNAFASGSGTSSIAVEVKLLAASTGADADALGIESEEIADIFRKSKASSTPLLLPTAEPEVTAEVFSEIAFNEYFGLVANEDLVIIRPYTGDDDDQMLEEVRPKYIVMFDPDQAFVRRVETYRAAHAGLSVRVYFLIYKDSVEEQRYLSGIRKEKDAFEKIIREKSTMAITYEAEVRPGEEIESENLRTVSSRVGGKQSRTGPPRVIVDVREFRSSLPSMLHAQGFEVVPLTISIGDYIITPEMCVERKALPDLISSFNSGRLYQQCELMTTHYKQPILLIEFDEKKSFNLESWATSKSGPNTTENDLRAKIVLLTLTFPRLRIIWSSDSYQTVQIFRDLKENREEPDPDKAILVGADETSGGAAAEGVGESGYSGTAQEILRNLPGITTKNYRYVMRKVENVEKLCEMELEELQELIGVEGGRALHSFIHHSLLEDST